MSAQPRTARGTATKEKLLRAAEDVFTELGYHEASIVKITEAAGVAMGTFYNYYDSKLQIFENLVEDLNRRVRRAMSEASAAAPDRLSAERAGFRAFFDFTARHPGLYRVIRQAEFVSPRALQMHYERIIDGYADGLRAAVATGEIGEIDPDVASWAFMGMGELIGLRWLLWEAPDKGPASIPEDVFEHTLDLVRRALRPDPDTVAQED
ncbi:TetR/AcrR family transcriptional regulator [Ammonicoccus fulvus]|uniref:TetR/AcrR family transcriptional regulator n=1 Tax=Ammonicoccus fulvus TaxID=3138240 RepID=A0ABZ3FRK3_9ACTN